jgi:uncharacterized protein (DUF302 family)
MSRETDNDRRTVLKLAGLTAGGVAGVAGFGQAAADENEGDGHGDGDDHDGGDENDDGLVTVEGGDTVEETVERIENAIDEGDPELVTTFDHAENAASVGEELRETTLILFGAPAVGTPIMQEKQTAGIDLPQKILVWCDEDGRTKITYNDPEWNLVERHGVSQSEEIEMMSEALANFAAAGAGDGNE